MKRTTKEDARCPPQALDGDKKFRPYHHTQYTVLCNKVFFYDMHGKVLERLARAPKKC